MGPIAINNAQDAINMLNQLQSGKSYMIGSDGKSIQEATTGHKIRQAFGFDSAKIENQRVFDLIKNTLMSDSKYALVAKNMFHGAEPEKAITAQTIRAAFKPMTAKVLDMTMKETGDFVSTEFAKLINSKDPNAKKALDDAKKAMPEGGATALKQLLQKTAWLAVAKATTQGKPFLQSDLKGLISDTLGRIAAHGDRVRADKTKGDFEAAIKNYYDTRLDNLDVAMKGKLGANHTDLLTALGKTRDSIRFVEINETKSDTYKQMDSTLDALAKAIKGTKFDDNIKAMYDRGVMNLQRTLNALATNKYVSDNRDFKTRLQQEPMFQGVFARLNNALLRQIGKSTDDQTKLMTALETARNLISYNAINEKGSETYKQMNSTLGALADAIKGTMIADKDKEAYAKGVKVLQERLETLATKQHVFDNRDFKTRLQRDSTFQNTLGKLFTGVCKQTGMFAESLRTLTYPNLAKLANDFIRNTHVFLEKNDVKLSREDGKNLLTEMANGLTPIKDEMVRMLTNKLIRTDTLERSQKLAGFVDNHIKMLQQLNIALNGGIAPQA